MPVDASTRQRQSCARAWRSAAASSDGPSMRASISASTAGGNPLTEADQRAKLALLVELAADLWSTADRREAGPRG
jgi:hypothetical protein